MRNTIGSITGASLNGFRTKKKIKFDFFIWQHPNYTHAHVVHAHTVTLYSFYSSLQALHGSRRTEREAEAEAHPDHLHQRPAEGAGAGFCRNALPGHLHQRGAGSQDRSDWSQSAGTQLPADAGLLQLSTLVAHKLRTDAFRREPF